MADPVVHGYHAAVYTASQGSDYLGTYDGGSSMYTSRDDTPRFLASGSISRIEAGFGTCYFDPEADVTPCTLSGLRLTYGAVVTAEAITQCSANALPTHLQPGVHVMVYMGGLGLRQA
jgi:hypothetical protein